MGREFELKYAATDEVQVAIRQCYGPWRQIRMETTYYDTPHGALSNRRITLRLRKENEKPVCTIKTPLPDGSRGEWECAATNIEDGIRRLTTLGAPEIIGQLANTGLVPRCGACFTRFAAEVATTDGTAELALDSGILLGGNRQMPLCEVEVELKSGSDAAAMALAADLAARFGLTEEPKSKFRRALALAQGE